MLARTLVARPFARQMSAASYGSKFIRQKGEPIPEQDARAAPGVQALAARLDLADIPSAALARTLVSDTASLKYANNAGLAKFGKTLLSFYVYEHFMALYPRLPPAVLRQLVQVYTSVPQLNRIASLWGLSHDTRSPVERFLADVQDSQALGRLAFTAAHNEIENGVKEINAKGISLETARGVFVRALVAVVYSHRGLEGVREFIHTAIIRPRSVDVRQLMVFSRPTRELAVLCERESLEAPVSRLIAETGRNTSAPVYIVGVFSGSKKLGEGQGASIKEARTRAAVNALQGWYLYSPVPSSSATSESSAPASYVDPGQVVI